MTNYSDILDRSKEMIADFLERLETVVKENPSIKTVFFHNFGRFDGILLLNHLTSSKGFMYTIRPLVRNRKLYEIAVFKGKTKLYSMRDSMRHLGGSLDKLAKDLCPELGKKDPIDFAKLHEGNLKEHQDEVLIYMRQDIILLGGVVLKAQDLYYELFKMDLTTRLTVSSLALERFRQEFGRSAFQIETKRPSFDEAITEATQMRTNLRAKTYSIMI